MKWALVLEGGASRAYFSVGVMDVLLEQGLMADYVIGASAGIADGISYVSGQIGRSLRIGTEYTADKRYMGMRHLLNRRNKSYYNIKFVFDELPNKLLPFDYEAFKAYPGKVFAAVTNIETGKVEYLPVTGEDKAWTEVVATCALPILFQPIEIAGKKYMDGGITDPIPVDKAFADGVDKALVILTRERDYVKEDEAALGVSAFLYRKQKAFAKALKNRTEVYNLSHAHVLDLERQGKAFVICPENTAGWKRTEAGSDALQEMYNAGRKAAEENLEKFKQFLKNEC